MIARFLLSGINVEWVRSIEMLKDKFSGGLSIMRFKMVNQPSMLH